MTHSLTKSELDWVRAFEQINAFWMHDGNSERPHALLTSELHSDGFFNAGLVVHDSPTVAHRACLDLTYRLMNVSVDIRHVDRVVGPAMGAIELSSLLALRISIHRGSECGSGYTEKAKEGDKDAMVFAKAGIRPGERILAIEDVFTTGKSVGLMSEAVARAGGVMLPYVCVLVNRSGLTEFQGKRVVSLINKKLTNWTQDECPLCRAGSIALKPKEAGNWAKLNAKY